MPNEIILIIFEGEKTEKGLFKNIEDQFFNRTGRRASSNTLLLISAKQNIYMLWETLKKDEFQTDIVEVLRESDEKAAELLMHYSRDDISQTYLFFDYDIQHLKKDKDEERYKAIPQMLQVFSDETELGKLYINYPMVEALRDIDETESCEVHCIIDYDDLQNYKESVGKVTAFSDVKKYKFLTWKKFCRHAVRRAD